MIAPLEKLRAGLKRSRRSRPEPAAAWPAPFEQLDLESIKVAHRQLLERYAAILAHSMPLPFFIPWQRENRVLRAATLRPLVQPFIEAHIYRRLRQLDRIYLYARDFGDPQGPVGSWLEEAREQLADHSTTLSPWNSWTSLFRLLGVPTVAAAAGLLGSLEGDTVEAVAIASFAIAFYATVFGGASFSYKRSVFLGHPGEWGDRDTDHNAYRAEDRLWDRLGLKKKLEPGLDLIFFAVIGSGLGIGSVIDGLDEDNTVTVFIGIAILLYALTAAPRIFFREWR